jgi:hypothetical protein
VSLANFRELVRARQNESEVTRCSATQTYTDVFGDFSKTQCRFFEGHDGEHYFDPSDIPDPNVIVDEDGIKFIFRIPL